MAARRKGRTGTLAAGPALGTVAWIHGDLAGPRAALEEHRRDADWRGTTYWRKCLTVSAAAQRARAGDRTAARRLAWRELVLIGRGQARALLARFKTLEGELARIQREPGHPDCAACYLRVDRVRGRREEVLAELARLPGSVPTYQAYHRRAAADGDRRLRRQLEGLGDGGR